MQLLTRTLLIAVTVLGASAWPRMVDETSLLRMVMTQLGAPLAESRAISPAETACFNRYTNATNKIGSDLANSTAKCEDIANRTVVENQQRSNATINKIRSQQLELQKNLQRCLNETDSQRFINCTVSTLDKNLELLDSCNTLAYQTQSQFVSNASVVETQRSSCISSAVSESKVKSIEAANDFDNCMAKAPQQRELPAKLEEQKQELAQAQAQAQTQVQVQPQQQLEQQPEQQVEQKPEQKPEQQNEQPAQAALAGQPLAANEQPAN
ncbi:putative mediator of RNA polymerase II transcription subunit 29 [Drosophila hydei]|uniref:Mediator of RNA polymerase II transcription subunit 29 n=1 Tax=Drosophila hydei TaxID=7224 RepID=A0A6J1LZ70_DROHY|nr:putative mediator of RNA polymerase II transcription subunit 29 [Drosophila hydei]